MLNRIKGQVAVFIAGFCFSLIGIFIKKIGTDIPIMSLTFVRVFIGLLFLAVTVPFLDKTIFHPNRKDLKDYAIIGFLMAVNFVLINAAFLYAPVSNVNLINTMYVVFTFLFSYIFLKEAFTRKMIMAAALGFIGLSFIHPFQNEYMLGNMLSLSNAIVFGLILVYLRREEKHHSLAVTFWFMLFTAIFLLPFPFLYGLGSWQAHIPALLGLGILSTGLSYLLLDYGLEFITADLASLIIMLTTPLLAIFFAVWLLGETLHFSMVIGGVMLLIAGLILEFHVKSARHRIRH
ncbi:DMT family transporter [Candidatus Woesearchaeota archaeon]|nr:DMT family transporter [Candidatus Woesearchaeota archaeon]